jgi:hypothetical protein
MYAAKGIGRVTLESGQKVFGKDFLFVNGAVVQGKVTVAGTGKPVAGAQVSASTVAETPTGPRSSGTAMAGPDGSYMLHVLPGLVQMSAYTSTPGLLSQPTPNKQVNVADGQTETANFEFKPDPTPPVNGKVVGADGKPVADANILVEPPRNQNNSGLILASIRGVNAKSDPDGKFTMLSIPNGTVLRARKGTAGTVKETTISSSNRDVTLTLKDDAAGSVLLRVTQPDGTPLPGAQVTVIQRSAGPNSIGTGVEPGPTKNDGTRLIKSLFPDYTYSYQLTAKGFGRESGTLQFQSGKQIEIPIKLVKADSFVAGMVTDETGLPAADQEVQVSGQKSQPQMIKTDIMGHFRAEAIVPGDTVSVFTVIRTTDASGRTLARAGERQAVPAGTDNVVLVNTPPPPPTTRPGGRRGP